MILLLLVLSLVMSTSVAEMEKNVPTWGREKELGIHHGNFKAHGHSYLKLDKVGVSVRMMYSFLECGFACVKHYFCLSFNFAIRPERSGHFVCELLASDKYNSSSNFTSSKDFHHYSIVTPCLNSPCKIGATCIPRYQDDTYTCVCVPGYTGPHCTEDTDECASNPCQNGATCHDLVNDYNCSCEVLWGGKNCDIFQGKVVFDTKNNSGRYGPIQEYVIPKSGWYKIKGGGATGGTHSYNYGYNPGTYYGGKGATMEGRLNLTAGTVLKIVVGQRGGNSVEVQDGQKTNLTAVQLGLSVEDNAGTGGGGGTFVYKANNTLLIAAGGGGGASSGFNGIDGQAGTNGASSHGSDSSGSRAGGSGGQPGQCNSAGGNYHGGVGAGWLGQGCDRTGLSHGERGGSLAQGFVGGRAGSMNSGYNGGPPPGAVGGFGGGGGGSEDNGASGGGGGYSGGGSGIVHQQAGGGGGSYCSGSGVSCHGITGGNNEDNGFVQIDFMGY